VCGAPAVVYLRFARRALCSKHFSEFVVSRVESMLRRAGLLREGVRILAAVSGGKDSSTMLDVMASLSRKHGFVVYALHIYLGLGEYSDHLLEATRALADKLGVPLIVVDVREILEGDGVPVFAKKVRRPECSVCGLTKRYIMNAVALELGVDAVATGHNADDAIAYLLKAFINQELEQLSKWLPYIPSSGSAVARVRPLYEVYEKHTLLYALLSSIPFTHEECPFRPRRSMEDVIKEMINRLEEQHPGIKVSFLRKFSRRTKVPSEGPAACRICGMPSQGDVCSFCRLTEKVYGEPLGPRARSYVKMLVARKR